MSNRYRSNVLDGVFKSAFTEYVDNYMDSVPSAEVLSREYPVTKKAIRRGLRHAKVLKHKDPLPLVYLKRVAIAIAIMAAIACTVLATDSGIREAIKKAVLTWYDGYVTIDFSDDSSIETPDTFDNLKVWYVPDRFKLQDKTDASTKSYNYVDADGNYIFIEIYNSKASDTSVSTEDMDYLPIKINGLDGHFFYDDAESIGSLLFGNDSYYVCMAGIASKAELCEIAGRIRRDTAALDYPLHNVLHGNVPDGYALSEITVIKRSKEYLYENGSSHISVKVSEHDFDFNYDKVSSYEELEIGGNTVYVSREPVDGEWRLYIRNDSYDVFISSNGEKDDITSIAESVRLYSSPEQDVTPQPEALDLSVDYIPTGFTLTESSESEGFCDYYMYSAGNGDYVIIDITPSNGSLTGVDTDNSALEELVIAGLESHVSYNETDRLGSVVMGNDVYSVLISGVIDRDELLNIASGITPVTELEDDSSPGAEAVISEFESRYVPDGFELTSDSRDAYSAVMIYENEAGDLLVASIYDSQSSESSIDKDSDFKEITLGPFTAYYFASPVDNSYTMIFGNDVYYIAIDYISGSNSITEDEIIRIAEGCIPLDGLSEEEKLLLSLSPVYITEGFTLDTFSNNMMLFKDYYYRGSGDDYLYVLISIATGDDYYQSIEGYEMTESEINGNKAYIFYNPAENHTAIYLGNDRYKVQLSGTIDTDEAIRICENIK